MPDLMTLPNSQGPTVWMFHYVRPKSEAAGRFPNLRGFTLEDFHCFLDALLRDGAIIRPDDFLAHATEGAALPGNAHLLTFDDGLRDHYRWVFPVLKQRGLAGMFFVTTGTLTSARLLRVHKIHALYGMKGYRWLEEAFVAATDSLQEPQLQALFRDPAAVKAYPYDDPRTAGFKYALNYLLPEGQVDAILDRILAQSFNERTLAAEFYLGRPEIREMSAAGMLFGFHGHTHRPFSKLDADELRGEMDAGAGVLGEVLPALPVSLSYPYGDDSAVSEESVSAVRARGVRLAFMAEEGHSPDNPLRYPRVDCTEWRNRLKMETA